MKQKTQSKKIAGVLIALSLMAAGCGGGGNTQAQVVLTFWDPFEDTVNIQTQIQNYQATHPNVQIVYTKKDINSYPQDLINALASGSGPDIYAINNSWLPQYIDKVTPAPSTIITYKDYKDNFVDVAVNDFTKDQQVYAVPLYVDSLALYYNKSVLGSAGIATPPKTWAELSTDVQKIKRSDNTGYFTLSGLAAGT
ncbi:MAG TPA: extracellular solute-binding protein, partial [Candidatus Limnocylindria bacterium]|nr:extracellular solute-binding protein [Candidatus Limnocylindria bacterium]